MLNWSNFKFISLFLIPLFLAVAAAVAFPNQAAQAGVRCEVQYGGGKICTKTGDLQIDKQVWDPDRKIFVDNLNLDQHNFVPGEEVIFLIKVRNTGRSTLHDVRLHDELPPELYLTSGSIDLDFDSLAEGETKEKELRAKVVWSDKLGNRGQFCVSNRVDSVSKKYQDPRSTQICIDNRALGKAVGKAYIPPGESPKTGPVELALLGLGAAAIGGLILKKKINSNFGRG